MALIRYAQLPIIGLSGGKDENGEEIFSLKNREKMA
jgi:hypothetical protein